MQPMKSHLHVSVLTQWRLHFRNINENWKIKWSMISTNKMTVNSLTLIAVVCKTDL